MSNLKRYYFNSDGMRLDCAQCDNQHGEWVKFEDIKEVLKPSYNRAKCVMLKHHRALRLHGIKQCGSCGCDLR